MKRRIYELIYGVCYLYLGYIFASTHADDGNIFGIYIDGGHLMVGDFWASIGLFIMIGCGLNRFRSALDKEGEKNARHDRNNQGKI